MAITHTSRTNDARYDISATQWNTLVDMFVGVGRVIVSDTEPSPAYDGDLWFNPGVPVAPDIGAFIDSFNNSSLDSTRFGTWTTGAGVSVVETTQLTITDTTTAGSYAQAYLKRQFAFNEKITYRLRATATPSEDGKAMFGLWENYTGVTADYAPAHDANWYKRRRILFMHRPGAAGQAIGIDTSDGTGAAMAADTDGSYSTVTTGCQLASMSTTDYYDYIIEQMYTTADKTAAGGRQTGAADNTWQVRTTIKNNAGTIVIQTNWFNTSIIAQGIDSGSSTYWVVIGQPCDDPADTVNRGMTAQQFQVS